MSFPQPEMLPVKKGDVIGWSGNSGSSGGPHLHFEVRDTKTEATINPQLFGITVPDNIQPVISAMYVYRLNNQTFNEFTPKQYFQVTGSAGNYKLNKVSTINLSGEVGFGVVTTDRHTGLSGLNGVYSILLEVDGQTVFNSVLERFQFDQSRAINAHIDYPAKMVLKTSIQKSFKDPGNQLQIYTGLVNNGRLTFSDGRLHTVKYTITDVKGNKSTLEFNVRATSSAVIPTPESAKGVLFPYQKAGEFNAENVKVIFPQGTLYNDLNFIYKTSQKPAKNAFSAIHNLHNKLIPLHMGFSLWIRPDSSLGKWKDKAVIVNTDRSSQGGIYEDGWIKASPRTFGSYFVAIDTIAPSIIPVNISNGKNLSGASRISFRISDNLSGIKSFNGYVDGNWVLFEFDTKSANLWHVFDGRIGAGQHSLTLVVEDMKGNIKKYIMQILAVNNAENCNLQAQSLI